MCTQTKHIKTVSNALLFSFSDLIDDDLKDAHSRSRVQWPRDFDVRAAHSLICVLLQQRRRWRRAQRLALLELDGRNSQWNNWKIDHQQHFYMEYHLIVFCFIRISVHVVLFVVSSRSRRYFCVHLISACACTLTRAFRSLFLLFLLSDFFSFALMVFRWYRFDFSVVTLTECPVFIHIFVSINRSIDLESSFR